MSLAIPSLSDLTDRARRAFRAYLPGSDAWVWPNNVTPTAKVIAGATFEVYGRLAYVERQKFAITADGVGLDEHGEEFGIARRAAQSAAGKVTFTASTALSVVAGATLVRSDGAVYTVTTAGSILAPGALTLPVVAVLPGKAGLAVPGTPLSASSGVTGTATIAVDSEGLSNGSDVEDDDTYRARILFRKRNPPHGGSAPDYVQWASEVAGVTRVFVERRWAGNGTVRVFPITDGTTEGGVPTAAKVEEVRQYIETLAPAGAVVTVQAANPFAINVDVLDLTPDTTATREAAISEIRDAIERLGRVSGTDPGHPTMDPFLATSETFSRSWLWQAVANATGEERHIISSPSSDLAVPAGSIPVLGTVNFSS